jgi:hypothetical protein
MGVAKDSITDAESFLRKVLIERDAQDIQWGGPVHDDSHDYLDWIVYIRHQLHQIPFLSPKRKGELDLTMREGNNLELFESRMVKVAALALAAVQSERRKAR